jgi:AcrR family transcriptional regulator
LAVSVSTGVGVRERKKQQTREALHRAAIHLYVERGPDSVTVNDICDAAGVSRRTIFNYFESKDDAVLDWNEERAGGSRPSRSLPDRQRRTRCKRFTRRFAQASVGFWNTRPGGGASN